ncbi:hypothetical protein [Rhodococcus tukisamuensis]|uniref:Uncharacterized protein n=1 Tax=Rhodococcus tukisamuensis TaxID=168276 RepID=A0A1G7DML6_9NOCA|nr:hypothetical protein [Rhodococcus tukisamuensis]SDE52739.1 hypothetical protein SAMN05444580_1209 [Rhodococcus tukisamuensis]
MRVAGLDRGDDRRHHAALGGEHRRSLYAEGDQQAGLTERYFYESFHSRDELLIAVPDRVALGAHGTELAALTTVPEDQAGLVRHVAKAFTGYIAKDRRRGRVMLVASQAAPELTEHGRKLIAEFTAPTPAALEMFRDDATPRDAVNTTLNSIAIFGSLAFVHQHWLTDNSRYLTAPRRRACLAGDRGPDAREQLTRAPRLTSTARESVSPCTETLFRLALKCVSPHR